MGKQLKCHSVAPSEECTSLLGSQTAGVLSRLKRMRRQISEIRKAQLPLAQANKELAAVALRAEVIAEAAVLKLDELAHLSHHDLLTNLPNRVLMRDRLDNAIAMADRHGRRFALLFVDLDGFKHINDTLGHSIGDRVLQHVARRLTRSIRASDTVSRHGGDEFLVLLPEICQPSDAAMIAGKLLDAICKPSRIDEHVLLLSASVGASIYPNDAADADTLISCADKAMYWAKQRGPGRFEFYAARTRFGSKGLARGGSALDFGTNSNKIRRVS